MAMWYLLKKKAYPFIIFNRAIAFEKSNYDCVIRDVNEYAAISYFVNYMMENVMKELEKEKIIHTINSSIEEKLTDLEYQTLLYILTMKGLKTVKDFVAFYRRLNNKISVEAVYKTMIEPLLIKGILDIEKETGSFLFGKTPNMVFGINATKFDIDIENTKRIQL